MATDSSWCKDTNCLLKQTAHLRDYAERGNYTVVQTYQDVGSSLQEDRPGLQRLMKDAEAGLFDVVLIQDASRLFRRWELYDECLSTLSDTLGISVIFTLYESKREVGN
jgi:DNA invertase Pin-like site-specific DNA recombinase